MFVKRIFLMWKYLIFIWLAAIFILALLYPIPYIPALGDRARVLFFHVPMAWVSVVAFFMSMFYSIKYLSKKDILYDFKASSAAGLGLLFCIMATVTGSVWAKFNWGAFWNWDPRQTSIFVLPLTLSAGQTVNLKIIAALPIFIYWGTYDSYNQLRTVIYTFYGKQLPQITWVDQWNDIINTICFTWLIVMFSWILFQRYQKILQNEKANLFDLSPLDKISLSNVCNCNLMYQYRYA